MTSGRKIALLLSVGVGLIVGGLAASGNDDARLKRFFSVMDLDGNQELSPEELKSGKSVVFLILDQNGSTTLTPDEMRMSPEGFKLLAGADGVVDGEEFIGSEIGSFAAIDQNRDGKIDYAELSEYMAKYAK